MEEELINSGWALLVDMGNESKWIEMGAKPFVLPEYNPHFLVWNYHYKVFAVVMRPSPVDPEILVTEYLNPIYPEEFDLPYNNRSMRIRAAQSFAISLKNAASHYTTREYEYCQNYSFESQGFFGICRLVMCPNPQILEMALILFVENYIKAAREHPNTYYFIPKPRTIIEPAKKRRRLPTSEEERVK